MPGFKRRPGNRIADMQPKGCIMGRWTRDLDKVFKALADPGRRLLLDRLHAENGQTLGQLCERLEMTRQAVTKHLKVLEEAIAGRPDLAGPREAALPQPGADPRDRRALDRQVRAGASSRARRTQEEDWKERPMADSRFVYVTYIRTTPEKLWQALIEPEFTRQILVRDLAGMRMEARRILAADDPRRPRRRQRRGPRDRAASAARPHVAQRVHPRAARRRLFAHDLRARSRRATRSSSPSSTRWTGPARSSSRRCRAAGRTILSSLKSLLETGESLEETRHWPKGK